MRQRSHRLQWEARILLVTTLVLGIAAVVFFVYAPSSGASVTINGSAIIHQLVLPAANWVDLAKEATLRIGSVVVAIFLMQILISFGRYRLRLAEFLDWRADLFELTLGDVERLKQLVDIFGLTTVEFVPFPGSPIEKIGKSIGRAATGVKQD